MRIRPLLHACFMTALLAPLMANAQQDCTITTRIATQNYPGAKAIPPTNNLLLPAGKAVAAEGQKVTIEGRVLDRDCMPVKQAVVELWQNSPTGRWLLAGQDDLADSRPVFAGAGRTYTDSDGHFAFVTAFPAPLKNRAPFLNIKVSARNMPDLSTALYFADDVRNDSDKIYTKVQNDKKPHHIATIQMKQDEDGALHGEVTLVLAAKAPYQTY